MFSELFDLSQGSKRTGNGRAFGTFGELLQGIRGINDMDFLVTFPIDRYANARFVVEQDSDELTVVPSNKQKSKKIAAMILEHYDLPLCGRLEIDSDIPIGKGLASSSADLVATARAVGDCYGLEIPTGLLESLLHRIEPTDGVMYPGVVAYYHRKVELCDWIGSIPDLMVVSIDEGGEVDTVEFNKIPKPFTAEEKQEYCKLLNQAIEAVRQQDVRMIGQVATRSALLNQKLRPKRTLEELIALCEEINGLGVLIAHSGTCIGILLSPEDPHYDRQMEIVCERMGRFGEVTVYRSWNEAKEKEEIG